jgi:uncharacterized protein YecE (DUF72 family)
LLWLGCQRWSEGILQEFPAVEVQQTFYKLPKPETLQRWRDEAPAGFVFCMKAWQGVTHPPTSPTWRRAGVKPGKTSGYGFLRPTKEVGRAWELTAEAAKALDARVVVVQTPPNMPADSQSITNAERFFSGTPPRRGLSSAGSPVGSWPATGRPSAEYAA